MVWRNLCWKKTRSQSRFFGCAKIFSHHLFTTILSALLLFSVKGKDRIFWNVFYILYQCILLYFKQELHLCLCSTFFSQDCLTYSVEHCSGKARIIESDFWGFLRQLSRISSWWTGCWENLKQHCLGKLRKQLPWCLSSWAINTNYLVSELPPHNAQEVTNLKTNVYMNSEKWGHFGTIAQRITNKMKRVKWYRQELY